ncbi:Cyclic nucleotide-gated cation channel beta-3 [Schistosoma japonicum]|nr:Cyclic nucleotide-gated cation channel beta-3 [Schistosoma japonicum]
MTEETKGSINEEKPVQQLVVPVSREIMDKAIAAYHISVSVVERLRTLRTKFTERTELIKAKEIEKVEVSESESDEKDTGTDPTKSDEKELHLNSEFAATESRKEKPIGWWKKYPNRKLIIRQPLCLACLPSSRKYFISKPDLPCLSIQSPEDEINKGKDIKASKTSEEEMEQPEIIGQECVTLKQISIPLPAWLIGMKDVFSATISPYSNTYLLWLGFLLIAVLYNYITIPFREAFNIYDDDDNMTLWYTLNSLMDTLYLLDILLLRPRIEFLDQGIIKTDFKSCALHYFKSLQFKINAFWEAFEKLDQRLNAGYAVRLAQTIIYMLYIIHLETCGYYAFNRWQGLGETSWTIQPGRISPYVYSFYVCMKTATSIGSLPAATNSAEFLFMTCYWLSGILVSAILIGQVIDILDSASANKVNYRKVMDATLSSMQQLHAPQHVVNKGEVGKEMYIVKSGFVEVVGGPNNSIVFVTLKEGSVFGEIRRMLNRDKKKANDEATKEKKKARREKSREINDDDAIIEVIPERPATPKLLETVVKAIETVYPDKLITKRLKGSFSNEFEMRRRSVYTVKPNYMITSTKSSNLTTNENTSTDECEQTSIGNFIPCQNDSRTQQSLNNSPKKDDIHDDKDNETDKESENLDQSFINERTTQQWIDMLSVGRNPIKRITSYFPHMLKKSWD